MASAVEEKIEQRNWAELLPEITASIFSRLTMVDILVSAQFVCKSWREVSKNPLIWRSFQVRRTIKGLNMNPLYRNAIDRSCGQIVDVHLEYFEDEKLLTYLCDRSKMIKRLRIHWRFGTKHESLIDNIAKLPLLENLELGHWSLPNELIEAVGLHCPSLESLTLISPILPKGLYLLNTNLCTNEDMIAIGKCIPRLRSLKVVGNWMTVDGLEAVLNGCTLLESLDLHNCANIHGKGRVWEQCTKQFKKLCRLTMMEEGHYYQLMTKQFAFSMMNTKIDN